jgi:hypothetical protein
MTRPRRKPGFVLGARDLVELVAPRHAALGRATTASAQHLEVRLDEQLLELGIHGTHRRHIFSSFDLEYLHVERINVVYLDVKTL